MIIHRVKGSVDTPPTGVDTMLQTQGKIMQNWSSSVDTRSGSVDSRDLPRKPFVPIWDSVSTLDQISGLMQSEVEEDHVFPAILPSSSAPNLLLTTPTCC
ncbi:hypothetical protein Taro_017595 [Colocasia esculenta]|uniref:Uncharacterized protein n=1 Tax=Colocasia esculenta TaxID=4460 RepID=A0A843URR3_COLES|nr:hypothetical protein [Colocasia esculenta]